MYIYIFQLILIYIIVYIKAYARTTLSKKRNKKLRKNIFLDVIYYKNILKKTNIIEISYLVPIYLF